MEELEERLGGQIDTVLEVIRNAISADGIPAEPPTTVTTTLPPPAIQEERLFLEDDDINWAYHEEPLFDDTGDGAGIEGDLELEDD